MMIKVAICVADTLRPCAVSRIAVLDWGYSRLQGLPTKPDGLTMGVCQKVVYVSCTLKFVTT